MSISWLTPLAALAALAGLLPLAAMLLAERRARRVRSALGVATPLRRARAGWAVLVVLAFALFGAALAQPLLLVERELSARADAEAYVVVDASRSMLAAPAAGAANRFVRAQDFALELRERLAEIPFGVASLTDRPLPHLFPTADREAFALVVSRALGVERPPPQEPGQARATRLDELAAMGTENYFGGASAKRLLVVLTDGESRPFDPQALVGELAEAGVALVVVRFWNERERVFAADGSTEPYRPDPEAAAVSERLAAASGSRVFAAGELDAVVAEARDRLGAGTLSGIARQTRGVALAPYLALAASLPLALALLGGRRWRLRRRRRAPIAYSTPAPPVGRPGVPAERCT